MKFENLLLQSLFSASLLVCLLVLGSMLTRHAPTQLAHASPAMATATSTAG